MMMIKLPKILNVAYQFILKTGKSFYTNSDLNIFHHIRFLTGYEDKALKLLLKDQYYSYKAGIG